MANVRWMTKETCNHANEQVCPTCDFDGYYETNYPGCPWREK